LRKGRFCIYILPVTDYRDIILGSFKSAKERFANHSNYKDNVLPFNEKWMG